MTVEKFVPGYLCPMEPLQKTGGEMLAIVSDPNTGLVKVADYNGLKEFYDKNDFNRMYSFMRSHAKDWKYPSELHLKECLDPIEGWIPFDEFNGDYIGRLKNVASRIMRYLEKHIYLYGTFDAELIATFSVATFFKEMFEYAPRFLIRGATNSGKSTLLDTMAEICYRGNLSGDTTEASLFRLIDSCNITPLLDEYQDYDRNTQNGIKKILKNGNVKGHSVQRTEKIGNAAAEARSYDIYAPLVLINQAGGKSLPEEVINRAISIMMMSMPDGNLPMISDREELRNIRDELYSIRCVCAADPDRVGIGAIYQEALSELQDPHGIVSASGTYRFTNRCRDILGTMYSVAKMIGTEDAILQAFQEMQTNVIDDDRDSSVGKVFAAVLDAIVSKMDAEPLCTNYMDALQRITTHEIADAYIRILITEGELRSNERVSTRHVTNILRDMGFEVKRDNYNHSVLKTDKLEQIFQANLQRYGTEEDRKTYGKKALTTNSPETEKLVVKSQCQNPCGLNNLTRNEIPRGA